VARDVFMLRRNDHCEEVTMNTAAVVTPDDVLDALENETIGILRETAAAFARPVLMYSIGKDSSVLLHLSRKAFFPAGFPYPCLHVDSQWEFREGATECKPDRRACFWTRR
jgi:3'-phosphoadenosine 5'-phosphosulfate sulfotransferase (PAPS reductase)/FAD synthetase